MKTKSLLLVVAFLAVATASRAGTTPTVEFKGAFIKITAGSALPDAPVEPNPPALLYIRKSAVQSITMTFVPRTVFYDVLITTWEPEEGQRLGNASAVAGYPKSYFYRFTSEATATVFCESLLSNQDG